MKKISKTETWVGLFLIVGIALITTAVLFLNNSKTGKDETYPLKVVFMNSEGLIKGSKILLAGAEVGKVATSPELTVSGDSVIMEVRIKKDVPIQKGSKFKITSVGLLGEKSIEITPPKESSEAVYRANDLIIERSESDFNKITNNAVQASDAIADLVSKLNNEFDLIDQAVKDFSAAAQGLSETTRRLNEGLLNQDNLQKVSSIMTNVDEASAKLPEIAEQSKKTLSELDSTLIELREGVSDVRGKLNKLDPALNEVAPTLVSFRRTADNLSQVSTDIRKGQGALGLMIYDQKFRTEVEQFVRNLRSYGVLRYRDPNEKPESTDPRAGYSGSRR